jgi:hypothetical protein
MPKFFVPFAHSPEQAEFAYRGFLANSGASPFSHPTARLFRVAFHDEGKLYFGEVGQDILNWRGAMQDDPVLAIVETTKILFLHTQRRGGLDASPILRSTATIVTRVYFDDFSARA